MTVPAQRNHQLVLAKSPVDQRLEQIDLDRALSAHRHVLVLAMAIPRHRGNGTLKRDVQVATVHGSKLTLELSGSINREAIDLSA